MTIQALPCHPEGPEPQAKGPKDLGIKINGFTLIELCVVISIMLLFAVVVLPTFNRTLTSHKLDREATKLALIFTQARQMANQKGTQAVVKLNADLGGVTVKVGGVKTYFKKLDSAISIETPTNTFIFEKQTVPMYQEIRLISRNGDSRRVIIEPFLTQSQVK